MIELTFLSGNIFVFDVDDWYKLRDTYRIVGNIIGNTGFIPSLPSKLLPEETVLLVEQNRAVVVSTVADAAICDNRASDLVKEMLAVQQEEYKNTRKKQISAIIDKIVDVKRQSGDQRSKEDIMDEELNKSLSITKDTMIWPILLKRKEDMVQKSLVPMERVLAQTTPLRTEIFKDLWRRGYYITSGEKFGGDFLVYLGDPIMHHAIFIIKCIEPDKPITPIELIAFGRLGVSVKKGSVLATLINDQVSYKTINWIDA